MHSVSYVPVGTRAPAKSTWLAFQQTKMKHFHGWQQQEPVSPVNNIFLALNMGWRNHLLLKTLKECNLHSFFGESHFNIAFPLHDEESSRFGILLPFCLLASLSILWGSSDWEQHDPGHGRVGAVPMEGKPTVSAMFWLIDLRTWASLAANMQLALISGFGFVLLLPSP